MVLTDKMSSSNTGIYNFAFKKMSEISHACEKKKSCLMIFKIINGVSMCQLYTIKWKLRRCYNFSHFSAENMFFAYNTMYTISHHVFHFNLSVLLNDKQKLSNYIILTVDKKKKTETKMNHWKICIDILVPILTIENVFSTRNTLQYWVSIDNWIKYFLLT